MIFGTPSLLVRSVVLTGNYLMQTDLSSSFQVIKSRLYGNFLYIKTLNQRRQRSNATELTLSIVVDNLPR